MEGEDESDYSHFDSEEMVEETMIEKSEETSNLKNIEGIELNKNMNIALTAFDQSNYRNDVTEEYGEGSGYEYQIFNFLDEDTSLNGINERRLDINLFPALSEPNFLNVHDKALISSINNVDSKNANDNVNNEDKNIDFER